MNLIKAQRGSNNVHGSIVGGPLLLALLIFCYTGCAHKSDPSNWKPGQVLYEEVFNRGDGFKEVYREVPELQNILRFAYVSTSVYTLSGGGKNAYFESF